MTDAIALAAGTQELALAIAAPAPGIAERVAMRYRLVPLQPEWTLATRGLAFELSAIAAGDLPVKG